MCNPSNFVDPLGEGVRPGIDPEVVRSAYRQMIAQGDSPDEALRKLEKYGYIDSEPSYKFALALSERAEPVTKVMESVSYVASGFLPVVGEAQDIIAVTTGYDPITMEKLKSWERIASGAGVAIPFIGGTHIRKIISKADDVAGFTRVLGARKYNKLAEGEEALRYAPANYLGDVRKAFVIETLKAVKLKEDILVYRYWGGEAKEKSVWYVLKPYNTKIGVKKYLALPLSSTAEHLSLFRIPKDTIILIGKVKRKVGEAGYGPYAIGKGFQIYVPDKEIAKLIKRIY